MDEKRTKTNECYKCQYKRAVPGNSHIRCVKPDDKMTGNQHGIDKGWFIYPSLFDPTWKTKLCDNYKDYTVDLEMIEDLAKKLTHEYYKTLRRHMNLCTNQSEEISLATLTICYIIRSSLELMPNEYNVPLENMAEKYSEIIKIVLDKK